MVEGDLLQANPHRRKPERYPEVLPGETVGVTVVPMRDNRLEAHDPLRGGPVAPARVKLRQDNKHAGAGVVGEPSQLVRG